MCTGCWGYWLDFQALRSIARRRELIFSEDEREVIEAEAGRMEPPGPEPTIPCPKCQAAMKKVTFNADAMLIVDRCPAHGIWLDLGELKEAQLIAETSDAVRDILLRKLLGKDAEE